MVVVSKECFEVVGDTPWPHIDGTTSQRIISRPNSIKIEGPNTIFSHHYVDKACSLEVYIGCWISKPVPENPLNS